MLRMLGAELYSRMLRQRKVQSIWLCKTCRRSTCAQRRTAVERTSLPTSLLSKPSQTDRSGFSTYCWLVNPKKDPHPPRGGVACFSMPRTGAALAGFCYHEEAPSGLIFRASASLNAMQKLIRLPWLLTHNWTPYKPGTVASPLGQRERDSPNSASYDCCYGKCNGLLQRETRMRTSSAPVSGTISNIFFRFPPDAPAADDTNYITRSPVSNMGFGRTW